VPAYAAYGSFMPLRSARNADEERENAAVSAVVLVGGTPKGTPGVTGSRVSCVIGVGSAEVGLLVLRQRMEGVRGCGWVRICSWSALRRITLLGMHTVLDDLESALKQLVQVLLAML
jgi:hypothetical protein